MVVPPPPRTTTGYALAILRIANSPEIISELFGWQEGYSIFTVSWTHVPAVRAYIARQEEHHKKLNWTDELKNLLAKNGVRYDPKYLL